MEGHGTLELIVKFPSVYPYTRFEIFAPDLSLKHHQNPFLKNLCMFGRASENWHTTDTVAAFVTERLKSVIEAGSSEDTASVAEIEEHQGEPVTNYYAYRLNSIMFYDGDWNLDSRKEKGYLKIGIEGNIRHTVRGAVVEVSDHEGNVLVNAPPEISDRYDKIIAGRWIRLEGPILDVDPAGFLRHLVSKNYLLDRPNWQPVDGGKVDIIGVLFPEEVAWREYRESWMFVGRIERQGSKKNREARTIFVRPARAGRSDFGARTGVFENLSRKRIALVGLGCIGAPSAFEFARCGVAELHVLDFDVVDAGATVRWPLGLRTVGTFKVLAVKGFIDQNYPHTKVIPYPYRIGEVDIPEPERLDLNFLEIMLKNVDLVYDASAELGLQHLLSDLAAERKIPYICVSTTPGAWGGAVVRILPEKTEGCWLCYRHWLNEGVIPPPCRDPSGEVQPAGCASPTFTGAGFDAGEIVLNGVRLAVSTLTAGLPKGYPKIDWDVAVVNMRNDAGEHIPPDWKTYPIKKHPSCSCQRKR